MKNKITRILSLLLVFCMMAAFFPKTVLADEKDVFTEKTSETNEQVNSENYGLKPMIIKEEAERRTADEKHFLCDDGRFIAIKYPETIHERVDGEWVEVSVETEQKNDQLITNIKNGNLTLAKNYSDHSDFASIKTEDYKISWNHILPNDIGSKVLNNVTKLKTANIKEKTIEDNKEKDYSELFAEEYSYLKDQKEKQIQKIKNEHINIKTVENNEEIKALNSKIEDYNRKIITSIKVDSSIIKYENVFGEGADLQYTIFDNGVHEDIILKNNLDFSSYTMRIKAEKLICLENPDNSLSFVNDEGKTVFCINSPVMYDSNLILSNEIEVLVDRYQQDYFVTYLPNKEWLNSSDRAWPVTIDPFIQIGHSGYLNYYDDYYIGEDNGLFQGDLLCVGVSNGINYYACWELSENNIVTVPNGCIVTDLLFNIRLDDITTSIGTLGLYSSMSSTTPLDTTSSISDYDGEKWVFFIVDINDPSVSNWYNGNSNHLSFTIKSNASMVFLYSSSYRPGGVLSYIPYLEFYYDFDYSSNIESGDYIIENNYNGRVLHYTDANNTVNTWSFSNKQYQKWTVTRFSDGTYTFQPKSNTNMYMEMYYGQDNDYQPITTYTYTENSSYPFGRFKLINTGNNTYAIKPLRTTESVLEVYLGENTSMIFGNNRTFLKENNKTVDILSYTGDDNQKWIFQPDNLIYDSSLETGMYYITNYYNGNVLSYKTELEYNNSLCVSPFEKLDDDNSATLPKTHQQWYVEKNQDNTYTFYCESRFNYYLELYYGDTTTGTPITVSNYSNNQNSPYIKVRLYKNASTGNYKLYPLSTPRKAITVYTGANTTELYHNKLFNKTNNSFVGTELDTDQLQSYWTFHRISGNRIKMPMNMNQKYSSDSWIKDNGCAVCSLVDVIAFYKGIASIDDVCYDEEGVYWTLTPDFSFNQFFTNQTNAYTYIDSNKPIIFDCIKGSNHHFVVAYKYTIDSDTQIKTYYVLDPAYTYTSVDGAVRTLDESLEYNEKQSVARLILMLPDNNE